MAQTDPGIKAMLDEFVAKIKVVQGPILNRHLPRLVEAMAIAYTNEFTLAELQEIHRFARSPSGTHYLTRSVSMLGDPAVVAANQAIFAESSRLSAPIQEEFRTKMRTYLLSHPELLDKMAAERSAHK